MSQKVLVEHWSKTAIKCISCQKKRPPSRYIDTTRVCVVCKFENVTQTEYKKCAHCCNYIKGLKSYHCDICAEKSRRASIAQHRKKGQRPAGTIIKCEQCKLELNSLKFYTADTICRNCRIKTKNELDGKLKCKCRRWISIDEFDGFNSCRKCREKYKRAHDKKYSILKNDPKFREAEAARALDYYRKNKEFRREYRRHYYYNVQMILYNKIHCMQWEIEQLGKKKINRNGVWHQLNSAIFTEMRRSFKKMYAFQSRVIEFMRTGKGKIDNNGVVTFDSKERRQKFNDYCDSDEGMMSEQKPIYQTETIKIKKSNEYSRFFENGIYCS